MFLRRPDRVRQVRVVTLLREYDFFKECDTDVDDKADDADSRYGDEEFDEDGIYAPFYPPLLLDRPIIQQTLDFVRSARGRGVSEVQVRP